MKVKAETFQTCSNRAYHPCVHLIYKKLLQGTGLPGENRNLRKRTKWKEKTVEAEDRAKVEEWQ